MADSENIGFEPQSGRQTPREAIKQISDWHQGGVRKVEVYPVGGAQGGGALYNLNKPAEKKKFIRTITKGQTEKRSSNS